MSKNTKAKEALYQCQWDKVCIDGREEACRRCNNKGKRKTFWRAEHNEYRCALHKDLVSKCCLPIGEPLEAIIDDLSTVLGPNHQNVRLLTQFLQTGVRCSNDAIQDHFLCHTHKHAINAILNRDYSNYKESCDNDSVNNTYTYRHNRNQWRNYIVDNHCPGLRNVDTVQELTQNRDQCDSYISDINQCYTDRKSYDNKYITKGCVQACCQRHEHYEKKLKEFENYAKTKINNIKSKIKRIERNEEKKRADEAKQQEEKAKKQAPLQDMNLWPKPN